MSAVSTTIIEAHNFLISLSRKYHLRKEGLSSSCPSGFIGFTFYNVNLLLQTELFAHYSILLTGIQPALDCLFGTWVSSQCLTAHGSFPVCQGGAVRQQLLGVLGEEKGVVMQPGRPSSVGVADAAARMRDSRFCLTPAGERAPKQTQYFDEIVHRPGHAFHHRRFVASTTNEAQAKRSRISLFALASGRHGTSAAVLGPQLFLTPTTLNCHKTPYRHHYNSRIDRLRTKIRASCRKQGHIKLTQPFPS